MLLAIDQMALIAFTALSCTSEHVQLICTMNVKNADNPIVLQGSEGAVWRKEIKLVMVFVSCAGLHAGFIQERAQTELLLRASVFKI